MPSQLVRVLSFTPSNDRLSWRRRTGRSSQSASGWSPNLSARTSQTDCQFRGRRRDRRALNSERRPRGRGVRERARDYGHHGTSACPRAGRGGFANSLPCPEQNMRTIDATIARGCDIPRHPASPAPQLAFATVADEATWPARWRTLLCRWSLCAGVLNSVACCMPVGRMPRGWMS